MDNNTKCPYCHKPAEWDEETLIHKGGPADGSFICHFEPAELPAGQPYCDCWRCEEAWVAIYDELDSGVEYRRKVWVLLGGERQ